MLKYMRKIFYIFFAFSFFGSALTTTAHAQSVTAQPDPVQYIVVPETPGPNERVYIEVEGVGPFLGNAQITWQQDGKVVSSGVGVKKYSFTTKGIGDPTRIRVNINSETQGTMTHDFVFSPSVTHLVWEADTTAPAFYRGKTRYSAGAKISVVAFPTVLLGGALVPSSKLSFQWRYKNNLIPEQSGLGRSVFTVYGDQLQTGESIAVDIYSGAARVGRADIFVPAVEPKIVLYRYDPLRGTLLDAAFPDTISLGTQEITLDAQPYFFSTDSRKKGYFSYDWSLNGQTATSPDSGQGLLTLRQTGQGTGFATINVSLQNTDPDKFVQSAQTALRLAFGQQANSFISNLFGL